MEVPVIISIFCDGDRRAISGILSDTGLHITVGMLEESYQYWKEAAVSA